MNGAAQEPCETWATRSDAAVWLTARTVWLEAARRKDAWVVAILMGVYVVAAAAVGIVKGSSPLETQFLMNLGLTVSYWLAAILTALFAARELPEEIDNRTLYPLLAKPVSRAQALTGKFAAIAAMGTLVLLAFTQFVLIACPWLPEFRPGMLAQALALQTLSLALLAALTLCLTVWLPSSLSLMIGLLMFFGGGALIPAFKTGASEAGRRAFDAALWYLPNFQALDLMARFTGGGAPLAAGAFARLTVYGTLFVALLMGAAAAGFRRKAL